jgi:hypothetical protein
MDHVKGVNNNETTEAIAKPVWCKIVASFWESLHQSAFQTLFGAEAYAFFTDFLIPVSAGAWTSTLSDALNSVQSNFPLYASQIGHAESTFRVIALKASNFLLPS